MKRLETKDRNNLTRAGIFLAVVLFLAFNVVVGIALNTWQVDLTENRLFTISQGTKRVLNNIDEPLSLKLFYSPQLGQRFPTYGNYARRVRDFLEQMQRESDGKIKLEVFNPEPFSQLEDRATAANLVGLPLGGGAQGYFGLIANNSTDDEEVIRIFDPSRESSLEYDITRILYSLSDPDKRVIGVISKLPLVDNPTRDATPWEIMVRLREIFEVRTLDTDLKDIDEDIDVLLIIHPQGLENQTLYAIDQHVVRGGRALVLLDPHVETVQSSPLTGVLVKGGSEFDPLLQTWGVNFDKDKVVADALAAIEVQAPDPSGDGSIRIQYLPWMSFSGPHFNEEDLIIGNLERVIMISSGYFDFDKDKAPQGLEFTPLIETSPLSQPLGAFKVRLQPDPQGLIEDFEPDEKQYTVAARLHGTFKSAYPDGPPKVKEETADEKAKPSLEDLQKALVEANQKKDENGGQSRKTPDNAPSDTPPQHVNTGEKAGTVILLGDADMLKEDFWLSGSAGTGAPRQETSDNASLIINALENLAGGDALIELRSRDVSTRPFTKVEETRKAAEAEYRKREQQLRKKLDETIAKLERLRPQGTGATAPLSQEQIATISNFRQEIAQIRQELRSVQRNLRKDVDELEAWLKFFNIWAVPLVFSIVAIVLAIIRRRRYAQRVQMHH